MGGGGETLQYLPLKIAASKRYKNINITPWHESNAEIMIVVIGEQLKVRKQSHLKHCWPQDRTNLLTV